MEPEPHPRSALPGTIRSQRHRFYTAKQRKGNCPLPLQPHPPNHPHAILGGTTINRTCHLLRKPDILTCYRQRFQSQTAVSIVSLGCCSSGQNGITGIIRETR